MDERNDIDRLLVSYLLKELTAEEEATVTETINSDPEFHRYFEEFKRLFRLLEIKQNIDGIDLEKERERFDKILSEKRNTSREITGEVYDIGQVEEKKRSRTYQLLRVAAVAASVLFILAAGWWLFDKRDVKDPVIITNKKVQEDTVKLFTRVENNISGVTRQLVVNDGTEVTLWNQSSLTFYDPFLAHKREITLKGKAAFKVAKDITRPFTVYIGDIATTALGTQFIVSNFEKDQTIVVHLIEGRVVVNSSENAKTKFKNPVELSPGEELLYNKQTSAVIVRKFREKTSTKRTRENSIVDDPSVPNRKGSWFMFNNQPLPQIFDQLEIMFNVEITYDRKEMQKLYFIGQFEKKDSLEYILRSIAKSHNLTLSKRENKFFIHN